MPSLSLFGTTPTAKFSHSRFLFQRLQQRDREISGSTQGFSIGGACRPTTAQELAISAKARGIPKQRKPQSRWQKRRRKPQPHLEDTLPSTLPSPTGPLPRLVAFDLDATVWFPEMYMLAGPPFKRSTRGKVFDCAEEEIRVYPGARAALQQLAEDDAFLETKVAYASRSNRTKWGLELLQLLPLREGRGLSLRQVANHSLIYPGCKKTHFQELRRDTGLAYTEMLFFDNERINVEVNPHFDNLKARSLLLEKEYFWLREHFLYFPRRESITAISLLG
ncbi:hypothetical protein CYMTET_19271 [Cymbomonas tetramitiformis]|uniref:Magnesium-dependent phosphatase 1 n=1 Tax=Cymbomonas tetramitiformis TaxID=36881 RepID=A0AAE0L5C7_9CHLO|nr:hypothetical protein CYMTET_19271 [Cymbomonas tetramitiformis]